MFDQGIGFGQSFPSAYGTFVADPATPVGSVSGILNKNVLDTTGFTYTISGDAAGSATLNATAQKITPAADANRLRRDGLRWIPKVNGEFKIPVVSIHTLGDLFVPFGMEQVYQKRAAAKGNSGWPGAARDPRHQPLRLHGRRAGRRVRRHAQVGSRRREAGRRRRRDSGDRRSIDLRLHIHEEQSGAGRLREHAGPAPDHRRNDAGVPVLTRHWRAPGGPPPRPAP